MQFLLQLKVIACVCVLTISWQYLVLRETEPYLEWQLSLLVPHSTLMSVHVTHRSPTHTEEGKQQRRVGVSTLITQLLSLTSVSHCLDGRVQELRRGTVGVKVYHIKPL